MIVAYLESIKYIGHMWPLAIFRILIGYIYARTALSRIQAGYLEHAYISERLQIGGDAVTNPSMYFEFFKTMVQSQWLLFTSVFIGLELLIAASYIVGYGIRITALMAMILSLHTYFFFDFAGSDSQQYLFYIHFLFLLLGAGRCFGLDYYFYKSRRGILW